MLDLVVLLLGHFWGLRPSCCCQSPRLALEYGLMAGQTYPFPQQPVGAL